MKDFRHLPIDAQTIADIERAANRMETEIDRATYSARGEDKKALARLRTFLAGASEQHGDK